MSPIRTSVLAIAASLLPLAAIQANDATVAVVQTRMAADAADEQLVDARRALWVRLTPAQKATFAQRERAWLNGGRAEDQQRCVDAAISPTSLAVEQCRLKVAEHHRAALSVPVVQASAGR